MDTSHERMPCCRLPDPERIGAPSALIQMKYVLGYTGSIPRKDTLHQQIQVAGGC